jgi:hypothetical protein
VHEHIEDLVDIAIAHLVCIALWWRVIQTSFNWGSPNVVILALMQLIFPALVVRDCKVVILRLHWKGMRVAEQQKRREPREVTAEQHSTMAPPTLIVRIANVWYLWRISFGPGKLLVVEN